jgi:hypothetical protein
VTFRSLRGTGVDETDGGELIGEPLSVCIVSFAVFCEARPCGMREFGSPGKGGASSAGRWVQSWVQRWA